MKNIINKIESNHITKIFNFYKPFILSNKYNVINYQKYLLLKFIINSYGSIKQYIF